MFSGERRPQSHRSRAVSLVVQHPRTPVASSFDVEGVRGLGKALLDTVQGSKACLVIVEAVVQPKRLEERLAGEVALRVAGGNGLQVHECAGHIAGGGTQL